MKKPLKKRSDECLFCGSRSCYTHIYRTEEPTFDEVACTRHSEKLHEFCNEILGKNPRNYVSNSGKLKRGLYFSWEKEKENG